jgi:putative Ca2+/H+ antiporter (TMEM165/GDT1 family)
MKSSSFLSSISYSFSFVFITDLTDKSLLVIVILSQKLPALVLFTVSLASLLSMNLFSILIGFYIPKIISGIYMKIIACILFFTFGIISIHESVKKEFNIKDLMQKTRKELNIQEDNNNDYVLMNDDFETNYGSNRSLLKYSNSSLRNSTNKDERTTINSNSEFNNDINTVNSSENISKTNSRANNDINIGLIIAIVFILCLSDIGDKSQITVITMAAIYDLYGVLIGSSLALTGTVTLAVLFGNWICEKISPKVLMFIGGIFFILFGCEVLLNIFFQL